MRKYATLKRFCILNEHTTDYTTNIVLVAVIMSGDLFKSPLPPAPSATTSSATQHNDSKTVVFLDLETTGLSTSCARIVEIAMVRHWPDSSSEGKRETWSSLVNPEIPIPNEARAIHGISDADVKGQKTFRELAPIIEAFIGQHALGGHNLLRYDLPLLQAELQRAGRKPLDMSTRRCVDTLVIFRKLEPHTHTLGKAVSFYCTPEVQRQDLAKHRAVGDATASLEVFCSQMLRYPDKLGDSVQTAAAFCSGCDSTSSTAGGTSSTAGGTSSTAGGTSSTAGGTSSTAVALLEKTNDGGGRLPFGKHAGRSLLEVARTDPGYLRWLFPKLTNPVDAKLVADALLATL
jgi:DNA polymerase-3 subunit epsilon